MKKNKRIILRTAAVPVSAIAVAGAIWAAWEFYSNHTIASGGESHSSFPLPEAPTEVLGTWRITAISTTEDPEAAFGIDEDDIAQLTGKIVEVGPTSETLNGTSVCAEGYDEGWTESTGEWTDLELARLRGRENFLYPAVGRNCFKKDGFPVVEADVLGKREVTSGCVPVDMKTWLAPQGFLVIDEETMFGFQANAYYCMKRVK